MSLVTLVPITLHAKTSAAVLYQLITKKPCRFASLSGQEFVGLSNIILVRSNTDRILWVYSPP